MLQLSLKVSQSLISYPGQTLLQFAHAPLFAVYVRRLPDIISLLSMGLSFRLFEALLLTLVLLTILSWPCDLVLYRHHVPKIPYWLTSGIRYLPATDLNFFPPSGLTLQCKVWMIEVKAVRVVDSRTLT